VPLPQNSEPGLIESWKIEGIQIVVTVFNSWFLLKNHTLFPGWIWAARETIEIIHQVLLEDIEEFVHLGATVTNDGGGMRGP